MSAYPDETTKAESIAQAKRLRDQARQGGLRLEAFLPPVLADWLLSLVERGVFTDPSEAVFVMLGEQQELEPHADLREEIMRRSDQAAMDDLHPGISQEQMAEWLQTLAASPRPEPAVWSRRITGELLDETP
jgi:antitoxin ParD1/3/4